MPIDIVHELRTARSDGAPAQLPKETCHIVRGDFYCRPASSASAGDAGTATQNQAKRFRDDAREVVKVGRIL